MSNTWSLKQALIENPLSRPLLQASIRAPWYYRPTGILYYVQASGASSYLGALLWELSGSSNWRIYYHKHAATTHQKHYFFLLCSTLSVGLDKIKTEDTKESKIKVGEEGLKIAKKIGEEMKRAVDNGSLTLTINGTVLLPDKQSLEIMEPKPLCSKGQTLKRTYCCKFLEIMHLHRDAFSRLT